MCTKSVFIFIPRSFILSFFKSGTKRLLILLTIQFLLDLLDFSQLSKWRQKAGVELWWPYGTLGYLIAVMLFGIGMRGMCSFCFPQPFLSPSSTTCENWNTPPHTHVHTCLRSSFLLTSSLALALGFHQPLPSLGMSSHLYPAVLLSVTQTKLAVDFLKFSVKTFFWVVLEFPN